MLRGVPEDHQTEESYRRYFLLHVCFFSNLSFPVYILFHLVNISCCCKISYLEENCTRSKNPVRHCYHLQRLHGLDTNVLNDNHPKVADMNMCRKVHSANASNSNHTMLRFLVSERGGIDWVVVNSRWHCRRQIIFACVSFHRDRTYTYHLIGYYIFSNFAKYI